MHNQLEYLMKNLLLTTVLLLATVALFAQPVSKKGEPYLPAEGDWAIAIDASPLLDYFGNFFSDSENESPTAEYVNDNFAIMGKKFVKSDLAYRASVRLNLLSDAYRSFSPEFSTDPTNTSVEDKYTRNFTNVYLSAGLEKRKGNTRIQGFYGAEAMIGFGTEKHKFEYGNDISVENTNPDRTEYTLKFQNDPTEITNISETGAFMTELKKGATFSVGARAFVGAEIFVFPKWSVGFEYGFSLAYFYTGNGSQTYEQWTTPVGSTTEQLVTTVTDQGGASEFRIDNDNSGGALFMTFYF